MAHVAKYKAGALGNMCAHYDRWGGDLAKAGGRENVDPSLTHLNYNLGPSRDCSQVEFVRRRIDSLGSARKVRKDAVRMEDCVLTQPRSLDPSRSREFFAAAYEFLADRYGRENVVSAYVHMDEPNAMPHMHFAWVPVTRDGRLSAKDVTSRADLRTLHRDMQAALERDMGCRVEVVLGPEKEGEKQLSGLSHRDYVAAKQELSRAMAERDHEVARAEEARAVTNSAFEVQSAAVRDQMAALDRAREAEERAVLAEERAARAEQAAARAQERLEGVQRRVRASELRLADLRGRVSTAEGRFKGLLRSYVARFGAIVYDIPERLRGLFELFGIRVEQTRAEDYGNRPLSDSQARGPSPDELIRSAREAAARDAQGPYEGPRRGGRGR